MKDERAIANRALRHDGYIALPQFLSPADLRELHGKLERFIREVVPTMPQEHVFYED